MVLYGDVGIVLCLFNSQVECVGKKPVRDCHPCLTFVKRRGQFLMGVLVG